MKSWIFVLVTAFLGWMTQSPASREQAPAALQTVRSAASGKMADKARRSPVIALDPGHPSERSDGRRVVNGISEVEACWQVAVRVKQQLESRGIAVVMTKSRAGEFVSNRMRAEIANRKRASLFLRLHCDAGTGSGFTVYFPDRQGKALGRTGPHPSVISSSRVFAHRFHAALSEELAGPLANNGVKGDSQTFVGSKQGALTGSIFSRVPAITLEMCVLDDPDDAAFIKSAQGQDKTAKAIASAAAATIETR